jgi:HlyD family secretion protein
MMEQPAPSFPLQLIVSGILFSGAMVSWACVNQINEVAKAQGKLIPKGETHKVQPVQTGKIARLAVKEGDRVRVGQVLVELDTEVAQKEIERLQTVLASTASEWRQTQALIQQIKSQTTIRAAIAQTEVDAQQVAIRQRQDMILIQREMVRLLELDAQKQQERLQRFQFLQSEGAISREQASHRSGNGA